jgi:hypothetical protein
VWLWNGPKVSVLAATQFAHRSAGSDVDVPADVGDGALPLGGEGEVGSGRCPRVAGPHIRRSWHVPVVRRGGRRDDRVRRPAGDASIASRSRALMRACWSPARRAELGDRAAMLGLGGELADPGGEDGVDQGWPGIPRTQSAGECRLACPGYGQSRVSSAMAFLAQASSTRFLPSAAAMIAAMAALFRVRGSRFATRCSRAMASPANTGSSRPARTR